jgi:hypothetical protein
MVTQPMFNNMIYFVINTWNTKAYFCGDWDCESESEASLSSCEELLLGNTTTVQSSEKQATQETPVCSWFFVQSSYKNRHFELTLSAQATISALNEISSIEKGRQKKLHSDLTDVSLGSVGRERRQLKLHRSLIENVNFHWLL